MTNLAAAFDHQFGTPHPTAGIMLALLAATTGLTLDSKHAAAPALRLRGGSCNASPKPTPACSAAPMARVMVLYARWAKPEFVG